MKNKNFQDNIIPAKDLLLSESSSTTTCHNNCAIRDMVLIDTKTLATCGYDFVICFWDLEDFSLVQTIQAHTQKIRCLKYFKEINVLVSASDDKLVKFWIKRDEKFILFKCIKCYNEAWGIEYHDKAKVFFIGTSSSTRIYSYRNFNMIGQLQTNNSNYYSAGSITCCILIDNKHFIHCQYTSVVLFNIFSQISLQINKGHSSFIYRIKYLESEKVLITCSEDHHFKLWNPYTLEVLKDLKQQHGIVGFSYLKEIDAYALGLSSGIKGSGYLKLIDKYTYDDIKIFQFQNSGTLSIAWDYSRNTIYCGHWNGKINILTFFLNRRDD